MQVLNNDTSAKESEQSSPYLKVDALSYLIPPPEDLIAKTVFIQEPIRTGGPFSFM